MYSSLPLLSALPSYRVCCHTRYEYCTMTKSEIMGGQRHPLTEYSQTSCGKHSLQGLNLPMQFLIFSGINAIWRNPKSLNIGTLKERHTLVLSSLAKEAMMHTIFFQSLPSICCHLIIDQGS